MLSVPLPEVTGWMTLGKDPQFSSSEEPQLKDNIFQSSHSKETPPLHKKNLNHT